MNNIIEGKMSKNNLDKITAFIVNSNEFPWFFLKKPVSEKYPCFSTYVFKEKHRKNLPGSYGDGTAYNAKNVLKEIKNKVGKIAVFPGENFHAAGHCKKPNERRIIAIFTFD